MMQSILAALPDITLGDAWTFMKGVGVLIGQLITALACIVAAYKYVAPIRRKIDSFLQLPDAVQSTQNKVTGMKQLFMGYLYLTGVATFEADPEGEMVAASMAYCRLTGRGESESLGKGWTQNIDIGDRPNVIREWGLAIKDERAFEGDITYVTPEGRRTLCRVYAAPTKDDQGRVIRYYGIVVPKIRHTPLAATT